MHQTSKVCQFTCKFLSGLAILGDSPDERELRPNPKIKLIAPCGSNDVAIPLATSSGQLRALEPIGERPDL